MDLAEDETGRSPGPPLSLPQVCELAFMFIMRVLCVDDFKKSVICFYQTRFAGLIIMARAPRPAFY